MLMVIFGAGASYDSSPDFTPPPPPASQQSFGPPPPQPHSREQWRPPLANSLFDNPGQVFSSIVRTYPKLSHILPLLRQRAGGKSVEEVLGQLQDESKGNPEGQRELATVQYYLRDLFFLVTNNWLSETGAITNYTPLIRDILRLTKSSELVCLVTFNYDLLLDNALFSFDYKSRQPGDQIQSHPVLKLFKPHGSVDWARRVSLPAGEILRPQGIIEAAEAIHLTSDFRRLSPAEADGNFGGETFFPAIAIPLQNKTEETFMWPRSQLTQLQELLPSVTKILIIGWQAREAHFIALLKGSLPKVSHLMVVGRDAADAVETLERFAISTGLVEAVKIDRAAVVSRGVRDFTEPRPDDVLAYVRRIRLSVAPGGFSDFALNRRVIQFTNA